MKCCPGGSALRGQKAPGLNPVRVWITPKGFARVCRFSRRRIAMIRRCYFSAVDVITQPKKAERLVIQRSNRGGSPPIEDGPSGPASNTRVLDAVHCLGMALCVIEDLPCNFQKQTPASAEPKAPRARDAEGVRRPEDGEAVCVRELEAKPQALHLECGGEHSRPAGPPLVSEELRCGRPKKLFREASDGAAG